MSAGADSQAEAKVRLRARMRARAPTEPDVARQAGQRAAAWLLAEREVERATRVALFAALPDEIPTRPLFEALRERGKTLSLPRIVDDCIEFIAVDRWEELQSGRYGVLEPCAGRREALSATQVVVVPGLAFDARGGRLGRGRGYYDRVLPPLGAGRPWVVGLAFHEQIVERVAMQACDRPVDAVASENGVLRCDAQEPRGEDR